MTTAQQQSGEPDHLLRGMGLGSATALNINLMIGVGPFITMPLVVAAAGGPQALLGWILGALLAVCDGLVTAELGAAMPRAGGSYRYLMEIYGPNRLGRLISFLFIWQVSFSAPLSIASGCIGVGHYASYFWPSLENVYARHTAALTLPLIGRLEASFVITAGTFVALGALLLSVILQYRRIDAVGRLSKILWVVVMATLGWIIFAGLTHFNAAQAFSFPPGAFHLGREFFFGLGSSMLIATYDYWGYYNVCYIGGEIQDPGRNIPRVVLYSILIVAVLYLLMNISILGVIPWQEMVNPTQRGAGFYIVSVFMERIYGPTAARIVTALIIWTAFSSVFSLLLGYSRVPYAAALDGNYFRIFSRLHPKHRFPHISLLALAGVAVAACFLSLQDVIAALVVIRILIQFLLQTVGVIVLRVRRPDMPRPFRMWLYPLPALLATVGFLFILFGRPHFGKEVRYAAVLVVVGLVIYFVRARSRREWPFASVAG